MEEKDTCPNFTLQEYECGQRNNSYPMGRRSQNRRDSITKKISYTSISAIIRAFFYPDNYPLGVSSDYGIYQYYNVIQTACIAISGALAFSALFKGMGVGQPTSNYLSASIVWLLKDGAGMIGRILFAWGFASSLDADCKRWHFLGDILNDIACILDLSTPYCRPALLFISSISNICRAITMVIHGSTRTVIFQHQARNNNVADITAKCSSLETMVSLVALLINVILLSILPNVLIWPLFLALTMGHLWANYKAKRCVLFNVFNHQRFHLVCSEYLRNHGEQILSIQQVNDDEAILFQPTLPYQLNLGISFDQIPESVFPSASQLYEFHHYEEQRFLLLSNKDQRTFYALLKPTADNDDLIRLNFYIEVLSYARSMSSSNAKSFSKPIDQIIEQIRNEQGNINECIKILSKDNDQTYEQFKGLCLQHGYNFHRCLFHLGVFRIQ